MSHTIPKQVRIATRKSLLALWQAEYVKAELERHHPGLLVELVPLVSRGDKILDVPLAKVGGKGLFQRAGNGDADRRCRYCCALNERCAHGVSRGAGAGGYLSA